MGRRTLKKRLSSEVERGKVCQVAEGEEGVSDAKEGAGVANMGQADNVCAEVDADAAEYVPERNNDAALWF